MPVFLHSPFLRFQTPESDLSVVQLVLRLSELHGCLAGVHIHDHYLFIKFKMYFSQLNTNFLQQLSVRRRNKKLTPFENAKTPFAESVLPTVFVRTE